jgi:hypothetical protein
LQPAQPWNIARHTRADGVSATFYFGRFFGTFSPETARFGKIDPVLFARSPHRRATAEAKKRPKIGPFQRKTMAIPAGFEPATRGVENFHSPQKKTRPCNRL